MDPLEGERLWLPALSPTCSSLWGGRPAPRSTWVLPTFSRGPAILRGRWVERRLRWVPGVAPALACAPSAATGPQPSDACHPGPCLPWGQLCGGRAWLGTFARLSDFRSCFFGKLHYPEKLAFQDLSNRMECLLFKAKAGHLMRCRPSICPGVRTLSAGSSRLHARTSQLASSRSFLDDLDKKIP